MLIHDQNTVPPESKETENTNPEVETVLSVVEDEMSKFTVEEEIKEEEPKEEEPSIAIPKEMLSENAETAVSEEAKPEEPAPEPEPEQEKKELTQEEKEHQETLIEKMERMIRVMIEANDTNREVLRVSKETATNTANNVVN